MTLLHRLRNLWRLSELDIPKTENSDGFQFIQGMLKKPEKVKILRKEPSLEDLIKKIDE